MFRHFKFAFTHIWAYLRTIGTCIMLQYVTYNRYMQLTIGSVIRVYYRVVWLFILAYSTSFSLTCTFRVLKQGINKAFYFFYTIRVPLSLDDTSPRCTYPAKDTTENTMFQKSTLPNVKCKFKFNISIYSQKSDLLTYFEKRRRVLHKATVLTKL